jgi:hypothetical protein
MTRAEARWRRPLLTLVFLACFAGSNANAWQAGGNPGSTNGKQTGHTTNPVAEGATPTTSEAKGIEAAITAGFANLEKKLSDQIDEKIAKVKAEILAEINLNQTDAKNVPSQTIGDLGSARTITGEFDIPASGLDGLISQLKSQGWLIVRFVPGKPGKIVAILPRSAEPWPTKSCVVHPAPVIQPTLVCAPTVTVVPNCYPQPNAIQVSRTRTGWFCH